MTAIRRFAAAAAAVAAVLSAAAPPLAADDPPAEAPSYRPKLVGLPFIFYTPETKLAFGAGGLFSFRSGRDKKESRTSSVWVYASYNLARQFSLLVRPEIYVQQNSLSFDGRIRYERTPQDFYGIGNDTPASARESYTPRVFAVRLGVKRRIAGGLFGGLTFDYERLTVERTEPGGLLGSGGITGSRGGMIAGIGAGLDWDTRDSVLFPLRGAYLQLKAEAYGAAAGSDFTFNRLELDLRKYLPLGTRRVLAMQAYFASSWGEVPFYKLALLGGDSLLRGYYKGRFRDKGLFLVQAEFRALLTGRVGVVGFAGLADVFPGFGEFWDGRLKFSAGSGLRYVINKRDGATVRLDMAWGQESFGLYITAREAF